MFRRKPFCFHPLLLPIIMLILSGCAPLIQPVTISGTAPTPIISIEKGGVENPNVFVDPMAFQTVLLQALEAHDTETLQMWMTEPFLTGTWRSGQSYTKPMDAIESLYADQISTENHLSPVRDADIKALMGGKDPFSIPSSEAGVTDAFLVSGWGKDGRDEAILFVARQVDNSLKWLGWMVIKGGFSGTRLGGIQPYKDETHGYSLYLPKVYGVTPQTDSQVAIFPQGEGNPGGAWISVEPANGGTAEQIVEAVKNDLGPGFNVSIGTVLDIEGAQALIVNGLPGQDPNRQLFMVHGDRLYHIIFTPDDPIAADAYRQMEDLYAMIVNTFHFTK